MDKRPPLHEQLKPEAYAPCSFAADAWTWFEQACAEQDIALEPDKRPRLEAIYGHLLGVNEWMNLTRLTSAADYLKFHILDSLTMLPFLDELTEPGDLCADLGSGGGYPGLPLMLWRPDRRWALVDSRQKKAAFLRAAIPLTGCAKATATACRGREVAHHHPALAHSARLVMARAVGPAPEILPEAAPMLAEGGFLAILKGPTYADDERANLHRLCENEGFEVTAELEITLEADDPQRFIVLVRHTGRRPAKRVGGKQTGARPKRNARRP